MTAASKWVESMVDRIESVELHASQGQCVDMLIADIRAHLTTQAALCEQLAEALGALEPHLPFDWAFDYLADLVDKKDYREAVAKASAALRAYEGSKQ